jgi:hypothetical protein
MCTDAFIRGPDEVPSSADPGSPSAALPRAGPTPGEGLYGLRAPGLTLRGRGAGEHMTFWSSEHG